MQKSGVSILYAVEQRGGFDGLATRVIRRCLRLVANEGE